MRECCGYHRGVAKDGNDTETHPRRNGSSSLETYAEPNTSNAFDLSLSLDYKFMAVLKKSAEDVNT